MTHPIRIQLSRRKGWKMPENTVKVDRTTKWGNPFIVNPHVKPGSKSGVLYTAVPTLEDAIECFRLYVHEAAGFVGEVRRDLAGKNLACWCKPGAPCHADVLIEIANAPEDPDHAR